jgi:hypothetical protein
MRDKRFLFVLLTLVAGGLIAAGCGGDDNGGGDSGSLTDLTAPENVPTSVDQAVELCKNAVEASGVEGDAKDQALQRCEQGGEQAKQTLEDQNINPDDLPSPEDLTQP